MSIVQKVRCKLIDLLSDVDDGLEQKPQTDYDRLLERVTYGRRDIPGLIRLFYFDQAFSDLVRSGATIKSVLDVGSGNGIKSLYISKQYPFLLKITGVELDPVLVHSAGRIRDELGLANVSFLAENIFTFQTEERFDLAILSDILEHVEDDRGCIQRVLSLLNPGGYIYGFMPLVADGFSLDTAEPDLKSRILETMRECGHVRPGYTQASAAALFPGCEIVFSRKVGTPISELIYEVWRENYFRHRLGQKSLVQLFPLILDALRFESEIQKSMNLPNLTASVEILVRKP